jgi:hypothetical protein
MSRILAVLVAAVSLLSAGVAFAHAFMTRSEPPVGAELHASPPAVVISFTEAVEPSFSTIEVEGPGGKIETGTPHAMGDGRRLAVELPKLAPGTYTVIWHATSVDTHKTEGKFQFTVVP